ncbi:MAG: hypothetical protein C0501_00090 [Isosphaera sp.]|nr:hypothetical protein [Isosphaera sp.]
MPRLLAAAAAALALSAPARAGLEVTALGKTYTPDDARVPVKQTEANTGGSTSVRNELPLDWKEAGYFQRNRDLGQVFTPPKTFVLDAVVLRTGPSDAAVLAGTPGAKVFVQFFEVTGEPKINDNGTPVGAKAKHGFSTNHRCDDFLEGVTYKSLRVVKGGVFPKVPPTRDADDKPTAGDAGKFHYLRWALTGDDRLTFEAGRRYAFVVGFEEPGRNRGFTLANANKASVPDAPALADKHDRYHGGWGLRREGDGTLPPLMVPGKEKPADPKVAERLTRQSLFADGDARYKLSPTTDGYPDVDTYRDHEFYLEVTYPAGDK